MAGALVRKERQPAPSNARTTRCIASLKTMPMMPLQNRVAEFEVHVEIQTRSRRECLAKRPGRISDSGTVHPDIRCRSSCASGHSVTRLPNLSRNTLKLITRSASSTSPPPSTARRERMRAAEFHGRNLGYDPTSATRSNIWRAV
jgi:hypothetical protein